MDKRLQQTQMKWFKHMTNASNDEFIELIEAEFGLEGYARWWKLLEVVAAQMDKSSKCSARYSWSKWQTFLKGKRNKLGLFLKRLENEQKIKTEENGNILEIEIPMLLKIRDEYTKKSGQQPDKSQEQLPPKNKETEEELKQGAKAPQINEDTMWNVAVGLGINRSLVGKKVKECGREQTCKAIAETWAANPAEPKAYFLGVLKPKEDFERGAI